MSAVNLCMAGHTVLLATCCLQNADRLDSEIIYDRDFDYDYFGFKVGGSSEGMMMLRHCTHVGGSHDTRQCAHLPLHYLESTAHSKCSALLGRSN